ncbi:checkpoint protein Hus1/Mec3 [Dipodascopsis tothii]|uniref:checkpoint protein Hus1/Mec3 n=1 Tax=Dipodascopsis tothii TaxID=44089 RepID=UPI0034CD5460
MRFSAAIDRPETLRDIAYALSFIRKLCYLKLTESTISIVTILDTSGTQAWVSLDTSSVLSNVTLKSLDNDTINMELNIDFLFKALKSCSSAGVDDVHIRLRKRNQIPYLVITIDRQTRVGNTSTIAQEIPVKMLRAEHVQSIREPECPPADVNLVLPYPLAGVQKISDRYRFLGSKVSFAGNTLGELRIGVENDNVRVDTKWRGLEVAHEEDGPAPEPSRDYAAVRIDARDWWNVLKVQIVSRRMIASICDGHALVVYAYVTGMESEQNGLLTYYMSSYTAG